MLDGCLWVLHTGAPWRDLPRRFGPWQTVYHRWHRWHTDGTWRLILEQLGLAPAAEEPLPAPGPAAQEPVTVPGNGADQPLPVTRPAEATADAGTAA
jgi:hypothetical protein